MSRQLFDPAVTGHADVDRLLRTEPQVQLTNPPVLNNHSNDFKSHIALKLYVINQPVAVRSGFNGVHAARLPSRRSVNTRGVFATTQAALNEAAYEWGTRLVGGVCYKPVPVAGSSLLANARSAIR